MQESHIHEFIFQDKFSVMKKRFELSYELNGTLDEIALKLSVKHATPFFWSFETAERDGPSYSQELCDFDDDLMDALGIPLTKVLESKFSEYVKSQLMHTCKTEAYDQLFVLSTLQNSSCRYEARHQATYFKLASFQTNIKVMFTLMTHSIEVF